jgi:hypothetical protein
MPSVSRYVQTPGLPARTIAGEAVVITPGDSRVHELNPVATLLYEGCSGDGATLDELTLRVTGAFEVMPERARSDAERMLGELVALGLLRAEPDTVR